MDLGLYNESPNLIDSCMSFKHYQAEGSLVQSFRETCVIFDALY